MDQINDDAWMVAREEMIERMWTERLAGSSQPAALDDDDLPY